MFDHRVKCTKSACNAQCWQLPDHASAAIVVKMRVITPGTAFAPEAAESWPQIPFP
jgi:hypothetical protein